MEEIKMDQNGHDGIWQSIQQKKKTKKKQPNPDNNEAKK